MPEGIVRIGFVGAGGIAQFHAGQLREVPQARIAAVCDVDADRAQALAAPSDARTYTDAARLLDEADIDALYVCVPPHVHGDVEVRAARRGLHLFVEKPVNLHIDGALAAWQAIHEAGVMSQTGYILRYFPGSLQLREFMQGKEVGTALAQRWGGMPGVPWWRRYDQAGGQLVEMTTHQVDLMRWVMGEVDTVTASYSTGRLFADRTDVTVPDSQAVLLSFRSGASAVVTTSCATGKAGAGTLEFVLRDARAQWGDKAIVVEPEDAHPVPPPPADAPGIDASFVRALLTGDRSLLHSPFDDAVRTLAVTLAANRSAEEGGRPVRVAELLPDPL